MKITTCFVHPPIPDRSMDWSAIDSDTYDGDGCPVGRGATEAEAIQDLREQLDAIEGHRFAIAPDGEALPSEGDPCPACGHPLSILTSGAAEGTYLQLGCESCDRRFGSTCP